jgi:hypothetical protein
MGGRFASSSDGQPDTDQSHLQSVAQVKELLQRMKAVAAAQRAGLVDRRAGAAEKGRLRRGDPGRASGPPGRGRGGVERLTRFSTPTLRLGAASRLEYD